MMIRYSAAYQGDAGQDFVYGDRSALRGRMRDKGHGHVVGNLVRVEDDRHI